MNLLAPLDSIPGVGPKTLEVLNHAGLFTVRDLLYYLPRTYENYTATTRLADLRPGKVVIRGQISDLRLTNTRRRNFTIIEGVIRDDSDAIRVVWFNQPYRLRQFEPGKEYYFTGNYEFSRGRYQLTSPQARLATDIAPSALRADAPQTPPPQTAPTPTRVNSSAFLPIYPVKAGFKSNNFKRIFDTLRPEFANIPDLLPPSPKNPPFVKPGARADALFKAHFAENDEEVASAREYLAYEELFELILAANLNKKENQKLRAPEIPFNPSTIRSVVEQLPFQLTNAQRLATFEILKNLERPLPMNRLLQGDVGSGKTVVAALAAFAVIKQGYQVALLAPTAILATQHYESISALLAPFGIQTALLTGATKQKPQLKQKIKSGEVSLVVGTHALLTDDTEFSRLALAIIDEQHRFGVSQRQKLLEKTVQKTGLAPHLLMMTATPIPRSLQLAIFGDLDVSTLNELPKGRQPITTKIISELDFTDVLYPKIRELLAQGQQVYWICKTIEDSAQQETASVKKQAEKLQKIFKAQTVAFLHGRMKQAEKDAIMSDFASGKIHILVSTTVVEVGVNVPNANLMVIQDADGYGLAQLHQLRGRVGRGKDAAFCFLALPAEVEPTRRLKELEKSTDGFYLAEVDLKLRGPGEIYGSLQHGVLDLQFASLTNTRLISAASSAAKQLAEEFAQTPDRLAAFPELALSIKKYQQLTTLN